MSKIKDNIEEKLGSDFVDTYYDHTQHFTWRDDCSECAKNVREFDEK